MGCLSGKHPEERAGKRPHVQKEEGTESVCTRWSPIPALWKLQRLFDRGGLCQVYQLPR